MNNDYRRLLDIQEAQNRPFRPPGMPGTDRSSQWVTAPAVRLTEFSA